MDKKDISFLIELHERLNEPEVEISATPNMVGKTISGKIRNPKESEKLTKKEMLKVLGIIQNDDSAKFYPIDFNSGFYPSYVVGKDKEEVLRFSDKQIPSDYNFKKLSEYFNVKGIKREIRKESSYYY